MPTEPSIAPWNDTARRYPGQPALHDLVHGQAARTPDAVAVVAEGEQLSYAELVGRADQLANLLVSRGIGPESRVGVYLHRGGDLVVALLGILTAGAAYVPLDPEYPAQRIAFLVTDAELDIVVTDPDLPFLAELDGTVSAVSVRRETTGWSARAPQVTVDAEHPAYVIYTSGSTGRPKGVVVPHRGIVNRVRWGLDAHPLGPADRVLQKTPYSFDVSVPEIFGTLAAGARLVMARPGGHRDPAYLIDTIHRYGITGIHFVPSMLRAFLAEVRDTGARFPTLRRIVCSGEELAPDLVTEADELIGCELLNLYGPTEAAVEVTGSRCRPGEPVSIGHAVANTRTHILDDRGEPAEVGELCLAGVQLARGYLDRPGLTAERFVPDPFGPPGSRLYRTGDLARRLPDGALDYLGRIDHQVKIRGHRVELGEIDAALRTVPGVQAAATAVHAEQLVGYVVASTVPGVRVLRAHLAERLPGYLVPSVFVAIPALPVSPSGKLDRAALPVPDGHRIAGAEQVDPRTDDERRLAGIWAELLGTGPVGVHDTFVELGGDSLAATRVCSRVRRLWGWSLSPADVLTGTVAGLVTSGTGGGPATGEGAAAGGTPPPGAPDVGADRPASGSLSAAQHRIWFADQLDPGSTTYTMAESYRLRGPVDVDALRAALADTVRRHPALRTTFQARRGVPYAEIGPDARVPIEVRTVADLTEAQVAVERLAAVPFPLAEGPLLRVALLRLAPEEHVLAAAIHHIIADDWSMDVLWRDLCQAYTRRRQGQVRAVDPLPPALLPPTGPADLDYWRRHLAGAPPTLDLPTDLPRPARLRQTGATVRFGLSAETTAAVRALARTTGSTPFMVLLTAFTVLIGQLAGRDDLVIGTFTGNRDTEEAENGIGMFVNTLALRVPCPSEVAFTDLLFQVRNVALAGYRHQGVPFDRLVTALRPKRDLSRNPVVQVAFQLLGDLTGRLRLPGVTAEPFRHGQGGSPFDLLLTVREEGTRLTGWLQYQSELFTADRADSFADSFTGILTSAVHRPEQAVGRLARQWVMDSGVRNAGASAGNLGAAAR
ncbi:amino acid adenylation domain-containing protein [Micromonospora peucetia]|uniref:Amino acid adenylation domain-containing protein n=1 Tax=Micromonospora peucetia TaxID=47871 RepID=A0ABZ1EC85_9ACTN|nr:amino acid adenylation domain-containing protein [Micromonospora peucetia]WSA31263.1 amino acid adenylation domain-containing protein [Micromonospora peucetia]